MSINRVNISGNLTRDVEVRTTTSGTSVASFGLAVNDRVRNPSTGEWEDRPNYVDCVMFGARAEKIGQYVGKGSKVAIEGKLRWSQWTDRDTHKNRSKLEVVVEDIEFFLPPRNQEQQPQQQQQQPAYGTPTPPPADVYDEDIPF